MKIIIFVLASLLFISCGTARKSEPFKGALDLNEVTLKGEESFNKYCHKCHPGGEAGLGPALNNKNLVPGFLIKFQVRNGFGKMPSFSKNVIPPDELDALVDYIKVLQRR
jgi:mono/diheme cytochrome c family protein